MKCRFPMSLELSYIMLDRIHKNSHIISLIETHNYSFRDLMQLYKDKDPISDCMKELYGLLISSRNSYIVSLPEVEQELIRAQTKAQSYIQAKEQAQERSRRQAERLTKAYRTAKRPLPRACILAKNASAQISRQEREKILKEFQRSVDILCGFRIEDFMNCMTLALIEILRLPEEDFIHRFNETFIVTLYNLLINNNDIDINLRVALVTIFTRVITNVFYSRQLLYECTKFTTLSQKLIPEIQEGKITLYEVQQEFDRVINFRFTQHLNFFFSQSRADTSKEKEDAINTLKFVQEVADFLYTTITPHILNTESDTISRSLLKVIVECFDFPCLVRNVAPDLVNRVFLYFVRPLMDLYRIPLPHFLVDHTSLHDEDDEGVQSEVLETIAFCKENYDPERFSSAITYDLSQESISNRSAEVIRLLKVNFQFLSSSVKMITDKFEDDNNPLFATLMSTDHIISNSAIKLRLSRVIAIAARYETIHLHAQSNQ